MATVALVAATLPAYSLQRQHTRVLEPPYAPFRL